MRVYVCAVVCVSVERGERACVSVCVCKCVGQESGRVCVCDGEWESVCV